MPPGFVISTEACQTYLATGAPPTTLADEIDTHLHELERRMGRKLGQVDEPLLVAVRSGGRFSMPGMMETVLNIGLTDESVIGLATWSGAERLAWDSYRRLLQMFGQTVLGIDAEHFAGALARSQPCAHDAGASPGPAARVDVPTRPDEVEQDLTARLLAGQLDPAIYRDRMAAVASAVDKGASSIDESPFPTPDSASINQLVAALPELPPATVQAAANLVRLGASVEDLVRLLDLTSPQALRIAVSTPHA